MRFHYEQQLHGKATPESRNLAARPGSSIIASARFALRIARKRRRLVQVYEGSLISDCQAAGRAFDSERYPTCLKWELPFLASAIATLKPRVMRALIFKAIVKYEQALIDLIVFFKVVIVEVKGE